MRAPKRKRIRWSLKTPPLNTPGIRFQAQYFLLRNGGVQSRPHRTAPFKAVPCQEHPQTAPPASWRTVPGTVPGEEAALARVLRAEPCSRLVDPSQRH